MPDSDSEYDAVYDDLVIDSVVLSILDQAENVYESRYHVSPDVKVEGSGGISLLVLEETSTSIPSSPQDLDIRAARGVESEDEYDCFPELFLSQEDSDRLASLEQQFLLSQAPITSHPSHVSSVPFMASEKIAVTTHYRTSPPSSPLPVQNKPLLDISCILPTPPQRPKKRKPLRTVNRASSPIVISSDDEIIELKSTAPSRPFNVTCIPQPTRDAVIHDLALYAGPTKTYTRYLLNDTENRQPENRNTKRETFAEMEVVEAAVKRRKLNPPEDYSTSVSRSQYTGSSWNSGYHSGNHTCSNSVSYEVDDTEDDDLSPIDSFFAQFPTFNYRSNFLVNVEYARLRRHEGWKHGSKESNEMYGEFRYALIEEFNDTYGMDENDFESWQYLCTLLDVDPVPDYLEDCREIVLSTHVNLVDLLDTHRTGKRVMTFETEEELSDYTIATKKFFPLDEAKEGGVLKYLLRHIFD